MVELDTQNPNKKLERPVGLNISAVAVLDSKD